MKPSIDPSVAPRMSEVRGCELLVDAATVEGEAVARFEEVADDEGDDVEVIVAVESAATPKSREVSIHELLCPLKRATGSRVLPPAIATVPSVFWAMENPDLMAVGA